MVRKIKAVSLFLIVLILVASFSAISVVQAKSVNDIRKFSVANDVSVNSCTLKWDRVSGADGYKVYLLDNTDNKYKIVETVKNGKTKQVQLKELTPATVFTFKIQAYKEFRDKEYDSELSQAVTAYTLPDKMTPAVVSATPGTFTASWTAISGASGYEIQFAKGDSLDTADVSTQTVEDDTAATYTVDSLEIGSNYSVQMRAYINVTLPNGKPSTEYGEWSDIQTITIVDKAVIGAGIDSSKPMVALSFDDGPAYNGATGRILDTLEKYNAHATFFMVGERINKNTKKYLKREIELGCELGNHTYDHSHYGSKVTAKDISKCSESIYNAVGQYPTAFRCPGGNMSKTIQNEAKKEGMLIGYWSVDTEDWKSKNKSKIVKKVKNQVYDGSIILMHDIYTTTADAVEVVVPYLIEQGYQIVTVSELIQAKTGQPAQPGEQYVDYKTINNNTK